jgi:ABC-type Co2+ transport system permease subunit
MSFQNFMDWFMALGEPYGVNPVIFGSIYVGAIPFFWIAISWLVYNLKKKKSILLPTLMACLCAISSYLYLIVAGENVPLWVYVLIGAIIIYAVYSTLMKAKNKRKEFQSEISV